MSRRRNKRGGASTVTRAGPRQPNIKPGAQNFKPVSTATVNAMYQNFGPQSNSDAMYSPGAPIRPIPGLTPPGGPRNWAFPVGYNIAQLPRSTEQYSFADLRSLASMYYGIQICQQVWFDYISKLELVIEPRPELVEENRDISEFSNDIQYYKEFFAYPDREHDLHSWLQMAVRDQLEIDAVSIYVRKDRLGRPYSLELLDGSTIKPLITDRGRKPEPGFPAYEQFVYGVPACFLTSDDLIYIKETERTDSVYGLSRVEKIILNVNVALRKQTKDLARFTDGTVPQGVLQPSMDVQWSQEEIEAYEVQFNNLMAGNDELRARVKVLPRGFEYQATDDPDIHVDLDSYLLNITASNYGITMAELAFTQDVNRSTGEMQENVVYRRAMGPLMVRYAKLFTSILRKYFKENRFIVRFAGFGEVEDFRSRATAYATLTNAGIISPSRAAHELNLPVDVDLPSPLIQTKNGPMLVEDFADPSVRDAQKTALIQSSQPPAPQAAPAEEEGQEEEEGEEEENQPKNQKKPGGTGNTARPKQGQGKQAKNPGKAQKRDQDALLVRVAEALEQLNLRIEGKRFSGPQESIPQDKSQTGMMIAFELDPEIAEQLALPGGESAQDMHVTLAFLGDMQKVDLDTDSLKQAVADFAANASPLSGNTGGVGRFTSSTHSDGKSPVIALVNVPGLQAFRSALVECVEQAGIDVAKDFDYTPHITLAYIPDGAPMPVEELPALPLTFDRIVVAIGNECTSFPLGSGDDAMIRHYPGGQDHDQKTHGDWAHPGYGATHDTTPSNKKQMQAKVSQQKTTATTATTKAPTAAAASSSSQSSGSPIEVPPPAPKPKKPRSATTHHTTTKKKAPPDHEPKVEKQREALVKSLNTLSSRANKTSARFAKLEKRKLTKTWTATHQAAAGRTASLFSQLAGALGAGHGEPSEALMAKILEQGAILYGTGSKSYKSLQKLLAGYDTRLDKLGVDRSDDPDLDVDEDNLDETDEQEDEDQETADMDDSWIDEEEPEEPVDEPIPPPDTEGAPQRASLRAGSQLAGSLGGSQAPAAAMAERDDQGDDPRANERAASADYRRWRSRALDDVKAGRAQRGFTTTLIPEYLHTFISRELEFCTTADMVRSVFERARDGERE